MSSVTIPHNILGLLSPILSQVEPNPMDGLPEYWHLNQEASIDQRIGQYDDTSLVGGTKQRDWLIGQLPTYSLDNIDEVMIHSRMDMQSKVDKTIWVERGKSLSAPPNYRLLEVFEYMVKRYIRWSGSELVIKRHRLEEVHALGKRMCLSFLAQHQFAQDVANGNKNINSIMSLYETMNVLGVDTKSVGILLDKGISENHIHLNGFHSAENNWADYLLLPVRTKPKLFAESDWRLLCFARMSARLLVLAIVSFRSKGLIPVSEVTKLLSMLDSYYYEVQPQLASIIHQQFTKDFFKIIEPCKLDSQTFNTHLHSRQLLDGLFDYRGERSKEQNFGLFYWLDPWRVANAQLLSPSSQYKPLKLSKDCRHFVFKLHFCAHLAFIESARAAKNSVDGKLSHLLIQHCLVRYMLAQNQHWQLSVQHGRTVGLREFRKFYSSKQRIPLYASKIANSQLVFDQIGKWGQLTKLEGRVMLPDKCETDLLPWLQTYAEKVKAGRGQAEHRLTQFGLVLHFSKTHPKTTRTINSVPNLPRFHRRREHYCQQAFNLFHILQKPSIYNPFIVGIDAASLELITPPEVFAPIFKFLRNAPIELISPNRFDSFTPEEQHLYGAVKRLVRHRQLGMTYHVGEEFRHLLSGLRAIDEVMTFLDPKPGDRLGHALALGLSPQVWLKQVRNQVIISKQEWLDTLVWVHHTLGAGHKLLHKLDIDSRIEVLSRELYLGEDATPLLLHNMWLMRQLYPDSIKGMDDKKDVKFQPCNESSEVIWRWNRSNQLAFEKVKKKVGAKPPIKLLVMYWFGKKTRELGKEMVLVDLDKHRDHWIELCKTLQKKLTKRVIKKQLVIETNPSSNVSIGAMEELSQHPIFDWCFDADGNMKEELKITVNTDNPGTANSSLAHEYYLLAEVLFKRGYSDTKVIKWLEWIRQNGHDYSFVRHLPEYHDNDMTLLLSKLRNKNKMFNGFKKEKETLDWFKQVFKNTDANNQKKEEQNNDSKRITVKSKNIVNIIDTTVYIDNSSDD